MKIYTDRELDLSNQVLSYLKEHPLISINGLNDLLKLPTTTLQKSIKSGKIPPKYLFELIYELSKYGLKIDEYSIESDHNTHTLRFYKNIGSAKIKEVKHPSGGTSFDYLQKQDRFIACDIFDLLD